MNFSEKFASRDVDFTISCFNLLINLVPIQYLLLGSVLCTYIKIGVSILKLSSKIVEFEKKCAKTNIVGLKFLES